MQTLRRTDRRGDVLFQANQARHGHRRRHRFEGLERKYAQERDKRQRNDAMRQYRGLQGKFAALAKDPHADPNLKREAVNDDVDVLIIGGGFAGLLAGGRLREQGIRRIRIVEKGADFGGTRYWNAGLLQLRRKAGALRGSQ